MILINYTGHVNVYIFWSQIHCIQVNSYHLYLKRTEIKCDVNYFSLDLSIIIILILEPIRRGNNRFTN